MSRKPTVSQASGGVTPQHLAQWSGNRVIGDAEALASDIHGLRVTYALNVNFNSSNTDTAILLPLPAGVTGYRVHGIRISGATAAINAATCGVFTQPSASGIAVVASGTLITVTQTGNDINNNMQSLTIVNQDIVAFGDTTLYFRVQTPEGSSANANVNVVYELLDITSTVSKLASPPPPFPIFGTVSSAGVFDSTGLLVRTLWSGSMNDPRVFAPAAAWNGLLDDGVTVAPTGTYTIKTLTNNATYTWEGVVGNTVSDAAHHTVSIASPAGGVVHTSSYHAHGGSTIDMCFDNAGLIYFLDAYDERFHVYSQATTSNLNTNNTISGQGFRSTGIFNEACCCDGTTFYIDLNDTGDSVTYVYGFTCSLPHSFALLTGGTFNGTIWTVSQMTDPGDGSTYIDDIAVQSGGSINNILFLVRHQLNTIQTLTKLGAPLQNFTSFHSPFRVEANPTNNDVWVSYRNVTATVPAFAAITLRFVSGNSVTVKFTAASFTYTAPSGYSALNGTLDPTTLAGALTLSGGNLTVTSTAGGSDNYVYSQNAVTKGYFEMVVNADPSAGSGNPIGVGIAGNTTGRISGDYLGFDAQSIGFYNAPTTNGGTYGPGGNLRLANSAGYTTGDNIGIAFDTVNGLFWFRKNGGNWNNNASANPATGTLGTTLNTCAAPTVAPTISKMTVDSSGNLTDTGIKITSISNPFDLAVSPDGSTLLVNDLSPASQQIKAFNASDGSVKTAFGNSGAFGDAGGYSTSPTVTHTKFNYSNYNMFFGNESVGFPTLAYAPDASLWVSDPGNARILHFTSGNSPTFIEEINYIPLFYANSVCYNDDTRVFVGLLEFKIDYTKPLLYGNGSWTLVNNWSYGCTNLDQFNFLKFVGTFSNGRTYARYVPATGRSGIQELASSGLRDTGVNVTFDGYIDREFNIWTVSNATAGGQVSYYRNSFTGFDGSGNPTWQDNPTVDPTRIVLTSQVLPALFPYTGNTSGNNLNPNLVEPLSNGVIPVFNPDGAGGNAPTNNHVGGIDSATGLVKFSTQPAEGSAQFGTPFLFYPESIYFNWGSNVNAGGITLYKPGATDFFTSFIGENFGNNQTNVLYHWHQTGLLVNRFGASAPYFGNPMYIDGTSSHITPTILSGMANGTFYDPIQTFTYSWKGMPGLGGNSRWGGLAFQNGNYYLYHNDEWYHGGLHRWTIGNLGSVKFAPDVIVNWNSASYVPPTAKSNGDLLATLPFNSAGVPNGSANWQRNPTTNHLGNINNSGDYYWQVSTNTITLDPNKSPDICFTRGDNRIVNATATLSKSLTRTGTGNWSLSALVCWNVDQLLRIDCPLEILDAGGKIIVKLQNTSFGVAGHAYQALLVNGNPIYATSPGGPGVIDDLNTDAWNIYSQQAVRPLIVNANPSANTIQVTYGDFSITVTGTNDAGADMTTPSTFIINYFANFQPPVTIQRVLTQLIFTG